MGLQTHTAVAEEAEGLLVARCGVIQAAELVFGVAEAVPGLGLADAVADMAVQGEGLLAERPSLLGAAEKDVIPADGVEGEGLAGLVGGIPEQAEGRAPAEPERTLRAPPSLARRPPLTYPNRLNVRSGSDVGPPPGTQRLFFT